MTKITAQELSTEQNTLKDNITKQRAKVEELDLKSENTIENSVEFLRRSNIKIE